MIDTHAHIYSADERRYPTIAKPLRPPGGAGTLDHLKREMKAGGVSLACAIQTSTFYRFDNRFILDSARANPQWMAGVCTLDPEDAHSPGYLENHVREYGVRGMRSLPASRGRLDHLGVCDLWKKAADLGIVINLLIDPPLAPQAERLLADFGSLRVVLDHCLNLKAGPQLAAGLEAVKRLSRRANAHAKLTFVPTGSFEPYPCRDMHDACMEVVRAFGADRCVWGSDFPCELWTPKTTYAQHLRIFTRELPLSAEQRRQILETTARGLWFSHLRKS